MFSQSTFYYPRKLYVVVHALAMGNDFFAIDHVISSVRIAKNNGADGVIIIPDYAKESVGFHRARTSDVIDFYLEAKRRHPDFPIGVNFLSRQDSQDNLQVRGHVFDLYQTDGSFGVRPDLSLFTKTTFFSGLAFKYSKYETATGDQLKTLCEAFNSAPENLIPTTSGLAIGVSADLEKIIEIRSYLKPGSRLAVASGVTAENVRYLIVAGVTDFLVATSLISHVNEYGFDILSPTKIQELATVIKG